jgi:hypothetical protein
VNDTTVGAVLSGASGPPAPGDWDYVRFDAASSDPGSGTLSYCNFRYGGGDSTTYPATLFGSYDGILTMDKCTIINSERSGIRTNSDYTLFVFRSSILDNDYGVYCTNNPGSVIGGDYLDANIISGNSSYGVFNSSSSVVDATYNYWGDSSGPGGEGPGTGDAVSTYVDYDYWLLFADTDSDGLDDAWELDNFGNLDQGPDDDPDTDGLSNALEYLYGTDPNEEDSDGDGYKDGEEIASGSDPNDPHDYVVSDGVFYVDPLLGADDGLHGSASGVSAWKTFHYAIDHINSGITGAYVLNLAPGLYNVALEGNSSLIITQDNVLIQGVSGASRPVIDGTGGAPLWGVGIDIQGSSGVTIQDLQIQNFSEMAIHVVDSSPTIQRNVLAANIFGIEVYADSMETSPYIWNNLITSSAIYGIYISGYGPASYSEILHNTIDGSGYVGIYLDDYYITGGLAPTIAANIITNSSENGIYNDSGNPIIFYNDVWNNGVSGVSDYYGVSGVTLDISSDPLFNGISDYTLQPGSPCIDAVPLDSGDPATDDLSGATRPLGSGYDIGCYEVSEVMPAQYTLTIGIIGNGSTVPAVGDHDYDEGTVVDITATPESGWEFDSWTGDVADTSSVTTTVTMNSGKTITATFTEIPPVQYTLIMGISGNGSTTPSDGTHTYDAGTLVTITATPDSGWKFDGWIGDVADTNLTTTTVVMDADKTVTAMFTEVVAVQHRLTMQVIGNGSTIPAVGDHDYDEGTVVDITATPDSGWDFVKWTGDAANRDFSATTVTMDSNKTVTATFIKNKPPDNPTALNPADGAIIEPDHLTLHASAYSDPDDDIHLYQRSYCA